MRLRVLFLLVLFPLFAVSAPLPVPDQGPALRIQGSNTIGAALGPALVKGLMEQQGLQAVHSEPAEGANEQRVIGKTRQGKTVIIVSHDLDIAEFCDKVLCFKEDGSYEYDHYRTLLKNEGKFAELWDANNREQLYD